MMHTGNVLQRAEGCYLAAQTQQFVNVLIPESTQEMAIFLRDMTVVQLLFRTEGKVQPRVKGQYGSFFVQ